MLPGQLISKCTYFMIRTKLELLPGKGLGKLLAVPECPDNSDLFSIKVTESIKEALAR